MTQLLALVSAPALETATVRHVEVLLLQPLGRDGRDDHLDRRRREAARDLRRSGRPGPRLLGERVPERAARRCRARHAPAAQADSTIRASPPRELAFLDAAPALVPRAGRADRAVALRRRRRDRCSTALRADELQACRSLLVGAREARRRARADDRRVRRAPPVHPGRASTTRVCTTSRSSARPTVFRRGCSGPSVCSVRCGWTTTRRFARCGQPPTSSPASSKPRTTTARARGTLARWPRLNATTTSCSASSGRRPKPRSRRPSGSLRASCTRTSHRSLTRRRAFGPSPRRTRCSRRPRRASCTTATATPASSAAATRRATSTSRT